jgi:C-terminal processing protease CtpA/Prc
MMVGPNCYVSEVRPDSDAWKQGLRPGDQILTINQHPVTVDTQFKLSYFYNVLSPQSGIILEALSPDGGRKKVEFRPEIIHFNKQTSPSEIINQSSREERLVEKPRYKEFGEDLLIVNLPTFEMSAADEDAMIGKIRKHKAVILDMRGNPGGIVSIVEDFLKNVLDHDIHLWDRVTRLGKKPENVKGMGDHAFKGKIIALVDNRCASGAEVTARVLQLEKRGTVMGDHTSGKVMEARLYVDQLGVDTLFGFGVSVTEADVIMNDGKSLENIGVTPDELIFPTAIDLARHWDPVLAHAATLLGTTITPEEAGKFFPYAWVDVLINNGL